MSTLSVSSLQNTASPVVNIGLNTDGSSTLALYNLGLAPTPVVTGTLWYDVSGAGLVIWDGAAWVGVGGGSGTVTGVTGTAPIVSSGGPAPAISITPATAGAAGSMSAADKAKLDGAATIVSSVTGTAPIAVATGTSTPVISATLASAAQAAAGTSNAVLMTPSFSVPKDAANMTGAALLPAGTNLERPGTPVAGMTRYSTATNALEYYQSSTTSWQPVGGGGAVVKAFVNIGITPAGVVTVFSSYNVASVVNVGGFNYDVTFTNAFPNLLYAVLGSAVSSGVVTLVQADPGAAPTSTSVHQVRTYYPTSTSIGTPLTGTGVWTYSATWIFVSYP